MTEKYQYRWEVSLFIGLFEIYSLGKQLPVSCGEVEWGF